MEWQNLRPARARAARLAFLTCALAALALSAPLANRLAPAGSPTASAQEQRFEGQWLVEYRTDEGKTSLTLRYDESRRGEDGSRHEHHSNTTRNVAPESLQGLTREQALSTAGTTVRFDVRRDAGTFACEGWFRQGNGSGHFTFVPNTGFAAELTRRGIGTPDTRQLFRLALADVGLALLDELKSGGYERPTLDQLVRMGDHGVRADYVRGLKELGYRLGNVETLIRMRDHGVSLEYVGELREAGFRDLPAEELISVRDHGVNVEFIRELRDLGYASLPVEMLVRLRDHGVRPDFIRTVKSRTGKSPTPDELIRMRDTGSY